MQTRSLFFRVNTLTVASLFLIATCFIPNQAQARKSSEGRTRTSVHQKNRANVNTRDVERNRDINRNTNVNRNVNINKNVNVNVKGDNRYYDGRHYYNYDRHHHHHNDVARALTIGALTGLVVGTIIASSSMSPSCGTVYVNGYPYRQCGNTWYQPQYVGSQVNYVVVNPPR